MLSVYTRHYPPCRETDSNYRRCRCPKWINGTLPAGNFIRVSAKTRSWENAERKARLLEINAEATRGSSPAPNLSSTPEFIRSSIPEPNPRIAQEASPGITIEQAVREFLEDEEARRLAKTTTCQSKTLFEKQLLKWARDESLKFLEELTTARLRKFRASWNNGALTTQRKHHRLNGFFDFCIESDWIHKNPSKKMKPVQVSSDPTDYFTPAEFEKIVDATHAYGAWKGGRDFRHRALRLRALILLMRWSGLSILDAVTLERQRLDGNRLLLYRHKTKVPVFVPLPPHVVALLHNLPNSNTHYFFWSGNGDPHSAKKGWQRSLRRLFKSLNLKTEDKHPKRCHPHMFRDTFAVELLLAGVPLDQVSLLLGHSSIKITEKHYAPFVKARQQQLEASAQMAWHTARPLQTPAESVM
jgi:integrase/recombinase XerD